jgi:hypothetical protein
VVGVSVAALVLAIGAGTALSAPTTQVPLGTTAGFVVLAGSGVTNTGPTTLGGDLGTFPTPTVTNDGTFTFTNGGVNRGGDAVAQGAKDDLATAYAAARDAGPSTTLAGGTLGGRTLTPGVYSSGSSLDLTGTLTLDGGGTEDAVFIFQAGSSLTTASASTVQLLNGASACNVFWQVGASATLGTDSRLVGSVLAETSITATTRAAVQGRLLAKGGAVTLDSNTITAPVCQAAPPPPEPTTEPTPSRRRADASRPSSRPPSPRRRRRTPHRDADGDPHRHHHPGTDARANDARADDPRADDAAPTTPAPTTPAAAAPPDRTITTTGITTGLTTVAAPGRPPRARAGPGTPATTTSAGSPAGRSPGCPAVGAGR